VSGDESLSLRVGVATSYSKSVSQVKEFNPIRSPSLVRSIQALHVLPAELYRLDGQAGRMRWYVVEVAPTIEEQLTTVMPGVRWDS
jgi:hypothetical protein